MSTLSNAHWNIISKIPGKHRILRWSAQLSVYVSKFWSTKVFHCQYVDHKLLLLAIHVCSQAPTLAWPSSPAQSVLSDAVRLTHSHGPLGCISAHCPSHNDNTSSVWETDLGNSWRGASGWRGGRFLDLAGSLLTFDPKGHRVTGSPLFCYKSSLYIINLKHVVEEK